ncbi:MAG: prephenate dehydrogenase/arogenate dehydrogenase family protein [Sedimentisphaerales bacterium]|nr:prephenate dehydrogenase/arogenate dehydrogenase family protein [Sedimentisphaerales bacterium]
MQDNKLEKISVLGLGLLGGSLGLAVDRAYPQVRRVGYSHRAVTREKALEAGAVDEIRDTVACAVAEADMVVLASPIGTFAELMEEMAEHLPAGCLVTDVGSTKVLPVRWARRNLPKRVVFIGSHPMAGSEQRGMEFARADLFDDAHCIITPTKGTPAVRVEQLKAFWQALNMRVEVMTPAVHDRVLARISHLPHVLAAALMNHSAMGDMLLCGKGFLDTTRIASGPAGVWRDILLSNAEHTDKAIDQLIGQLQMWQKKLRQGDEKAIYQLLEKARVTRNELVERKLTRKELPA